MSTAVARPLEASGLVVRRGGRTILAGLDLAAARGAVTAVLGPNGAGKTTLVRCCTGVWRPDAGTVRLLGSTPAAAIAAGRVGLMPQSTGAWSGVRAGELLRYLAGLYADPEPVDELMERLRISDVARTPYRRLSGGQRQAVNLAGAIVGRPELAFLDEPTAGMDPHARRTTWQVVAALREAGTAVVLTTHAMDEAERLADRVVLMDHGREVTSGTVAELTATQTLEELFVARTSENES